VPERLLSVAFLLLCSGLAFGQNLRLNDVYPEKARYAPGDPVRLVVELTGQSAAAGDTLSGSVTDLGLEAGNCVPITLTASASSRLELSCSVPATDFRGYMVSVELRSKDRLLDARRTAVDVSSDWKRFPRYGYLAHYSASEGASPEAWVDELNRFHINGLQFYDFQYRHDQPLAGTPQHPDETWKDIAGREVDASIVRGFIAQAHVHAMMAMAYNASYSAYDDVFTRSQPLPLAWGTWPSAQGPRTAATAKSLPLQGTKWVTPKLLYMNQNSVGWQDYLFAQMRTLFEVYPFDGWHIDTFGEKGGYAFDRSRVDYISGFTTYIDRAHAALHKRIVFNAVGTYGQDAIARSDADFVYSELWEDHETFASLSWTAQQVHVANPSKGYVMAAYVNRYEGNPSGRPHADEFNPASVLLADAAIFSLGASHIELGDGDRMLSNEYFPADTQLSVSPQLHGELRHYYDFLTAYEVYLRDSLTPAPASIQIDDLPADPTGVPDTIWTIARQRGSLTMLHLINLLGSDDPHWRDSSNSRPDAPQLKDLHLHLTVPGNVVSVGWASPDSDDGLFHTLSFTKTTDATGTHLSLALPTLHYWDTIFLQMQAP
jgi:dextranase